MLKKDNPLTVNLRADTRKVQTPPKDRHCRKGRHGDSACALEEVQTLAYCALESQTQKPFFARRLRGPEIPFKATWRARQCRGNDVSVVVCPPSLRYQQARIKSCALLLCVLSIIVHREGFLHKAVTAKRG